MTLQKLASEIARREGKKSQAKIGDIREILGALSDVWFELYEEGGKSFDRLFDSFIKNGKRRARKKK